MSNEYSAGERTDTASLSTRVSLALAKEKGVDPWESSLLYETLDPSILEALDAQDGDDWRLEFEAGENTVVVTGDGEVTVDGARFSDREFREALDALDWTFPRNTGLR